ncbi:MAG: hypothetical protein L6R41_003407 [Letrouitia leprolyta]|nr:MAG: hypothetical protein L6R41_003407 [Letrouitia leprolyta]
MQTIQAILDAQNRSIEHTIRGNPHDIAEHQENWLTKLMAKAIKGQDEKWNRDRMNRQSNGGDTPDLPRAIMADGSKNRPTQPSAETVVTEDSPRTPSTFPFLKLPPELRMMVYKFHYFQKPSHDNFCYQPSICGRGQPPCSSGYVNNRIPLQKLWVASKLVYHEAMPLFFQTRNFKLGNIEPLGAFLVTIGPYHRQYITSISFRYEKDRDTGAFEVQQAFRLLGECPNLTQLTLSFNGNILERHNPALPGMLHLLKIRGVEKLEIDFHFIDNGRYSNIGTVSTDFDEQKELFTSKFAILKEPYKAAEIKRREARGIVKSAGPRINFTPKAESRAERVSRRQQLKDVA